MRRDALRTMLFRAALASGILLLLASGVAFAQGFSGYEAFAGIPNSAGTGKNDNLFAGWTDTDVHRIVPSVTSTRFFHIFSSEPNLI